MNNTPGTIDEEITKAKANEAYDALKLEFDQRIVSIKAEQKAFRTAQNGYMVIDDDGGVDVGNGLRGRALVSRDVAMALIANMLPTRTKSIKPATTYVSFPELTASLSSLNDVAKNDLAVRNAAVTTALEKQFMQQLVQQLAIKHEIS